MGGYKTGVFGPTTKQQRTENMNSARRHQRRTNASRERCEAVIYFFQEECLLKHDNNSFLEDLKRELCTRDLKVEEKLLIPLEACEHICFSSITSNPVAV